MLPPNSSFSWGKRWWSQSTKSGSLYGHQDKIQCTPSLGNPRKPWTSPVGGPFILECSQCFIHFFPNHAPRFSFRSVKMDPTFSLVIIHSFLFSLYWVRKLSATPMRFFRCSSVSCWRTQPVQTFRIWNCCNVRAILASLALCKKCVAISHCMSVIVRWQLSLRRVCKHHTVLSNVVLGYPSHSSSCTFFSCLRTSTALLNIFKVHYILFFVGCA